MDEDDQTELSLSVPRLLDGVRVDRALSMLAEITRAEAAAIIAAGAVVVNGKVVTKASLALREHDALVAVVPERQVPFVAPDPRVGVNEVYLDDDVIVVDKAPDQVVHPGAGNKEGTLVAGLLARHPELQALVDDRICEPERPGIVHRLDRGTSGLLVVARNEEAFDSLSEQMADRSVGRRYLALVRGHLANDRGLIDAPIGRSTRTPTLMAISRTGKQARTTYTVISRLDVSGPVTLVSLALETGRTHQIRIHLTSIGHPVIGDLRYGGPAHPLLDHERFFLHAYKLSFNHPGTNERVEFTAQLPEDLARLLPERVDVEGLDEL